MFMACPLEVFILQSVAGAAQNSLVNREKASLPPTLLLLLLPLLQQRSLSLTLLLPAVAADGGFFGGRWTLGGESVRVSIVWNRPE